MSNIGLNNMLLSNVKRVIRTLIHETRVWIEKIKRWLSQAFISEQEKKKQLIICGYPRSGTSLFYNMISSSLKGFNIDNWETSALDSIWRFDNHASKSPVDLFQLTEVVESNVHDKDLCVIILIRDIRDIITSRHQFSPDDFVIGYQGAYSFSGEYPNYKKKFDGPGIGKYYSVMNELSDNNLFNLIIIKYEDLVSDPDKCQKKVASTFNLPFDGLFSSYHLRKDQHKLKYEGKFSALDKTLEKSSSQVEKKFVKRWAELAYKERIIEQFTDYPQLFEILIEQGYEETRDWFNEL